MAYRGRLSHGTSKQTGHPGAGLRNPDPLKSVPTPPRLLRRFLLPIVALTLLGAFPAAADSLVSIYIDEDNDPGTGCSAIVPGDTFHGAEQVVHTTVDTAANRVTNVSRQDCKTGNTPPSFGPLIPVSPGGWAVGVGLGTSGSDVVETFLPLASLQPANPHEGRLGFVRLRTCEAGRRTRVYMGEVSVFACVSKLRHRTTSIYD